MQILCIKKTRMDKLIELILLHDKRWPVPCARAIASKPPRAEIGAAARENLDSFTN
jgi:hypothetical protein